VWPIKLGLPDGPRGRHPEPVDAFGKLFCMAVGWVADEPQPGRVEVVMTDADGRTWRFFDKPPIFDAGSDLTSRSNYPVSVTVRVRVLEEADLLTVSTDPDGVASEEGETVFRVPASLVKR
jgi:hypothetical protein